MRRGAGAAVGLLVAALATGCSDDPSSGVTCTLMGAVHGLSVTVTPDLAPVRTLQLEVCTDGRRSPHRVRLGSGPDRSQVGFIRADLPAGTVDVSGRYEVAGRSVELEPVAVDVRPAYPNGRQCGADGTAGAVTVDVDGLR